MLLEGQEKGTILGSFCRQDELEHGAKGTFLIVNARFEVWARYLNRPHTWGHIIGKPRKATSGDSIGLTVPLTLRAPVGFDA